MSDIPPSILEPVNHIEFKTTIKQTVSQMLMFKTNEYSSIPSNSLLRILTVAAVATLTACAPSSEDTADAVTSYTLNQAEQGAALYNAQCAACHGDDLQGGGAGPALLGSAFSDRWQSQDVHALYQLISTSMPPAGGEALGNVRLSECDCLPAAGQSHRTRRKPPERRDSHTVGGYACQRSGRVFQLPGHDRRAGNRRDGCRRD